VTSLVVSCGDKAPITPNAPVESVSQVLKPTADEPAFAALSSFSIEACSLDAVNGVAAKEVNQVVNTSSVEIAGWAADLPRQRAWSKAWIVFEGPETFYIEISTREERPDVAAAYSSQDMLASGWRVLLNLSHLRSGIYLIKTVIPDDGRNLLCDTKRRIMMR
jgi:hypothetical protein